MQDVIQREIHINAPQKRVYEAIANPELVVLWFPTTLEGKYQVGERPIFGFGEHGKNQIYLVDARPHNYFAYRWVPGGGCKVTLTESGFAKLPIEMMETCINQNSRGWDFMLNRLLNHFG